MSRLVNRQVLRELSEPHVQQRMTWWRLPLHRPTDSHVGGIDRITYVSWTAVILLAGFVLRLARVPRVIYLDEAWVVNSVVDLTWRDMLFNPKWLPIPPPAFLVVLRGILRLIGPTEMRVELLFLVVSVAVMIAAAILGRQLFDRPGALAFTAIMALSPVALGRSTQVKWYGSDLLIVCLILILLAGYLRAPSHSRYLAIVASLIAALAFSYTAVFLVLPACWIVWRAGPRAGQWLRLAACAVSPAIAGFLIWYAFVYPYRNNSNMRQYWVQFFPPAGPAIARYYAHRFADLALFIYYPSTFSSRLIPAGIGLVLIYGAWSLFPSTRNKDSRRELAMATAFFPLATLLTLNAVRLYPLGGERTNLFALPSLAVLFVAGVEGSARLLRRIRPFPVAPILSVALALWIFAAVVSIRGESSAVAADVPQALQFLQQNSAPGDAILLHPTLDEQFRFYRRLAPDPPGEFVTGAVGYTCCMRSGPFIIGPIPTEVLLADFGRVLDTTSSKKVWYVYDDSLGGPSATKRDERGQLLLAVRQRGCRISEPRYFGGISVDEIACTFP